MWQNASAWLARVSPSTSAMRPIPGCARRPCGDGRPDANWLPAATSGNRLGAQRLLARMAVAPGWISGIGFRQQAQQETR